MKTCINRIILSVLLVACGVGTSLGAMGLESHDEKSIDCCCQANYSINLMWINRNLEREQPFIHPSKNESSLIANFLRPAATWAFLHKGAVVNVWYDSYFLTDGAILSTQRFIDKYRNRDLMAPIILRDVRTIPKVVENATVFSEKIPVFFRVDLLRVVAALHVLKNAKEPTCFVYADLDIKPLSLEKLFDAETLKNFQAYGFVMAKGGAVVGNGYTALYENSFQIISNNNANLLKAMSLVLVDVQIERAKNALRGQFFGHRGQCVMKRLQESVYESYRDMLIYWRSLEGKKDGWKLLLVDEKGRKRDYNEKIDGLRIFGLKHGCCYFRLVRVFESKLPLVALVMNIFYDEEVADLMIPVKEVCAPPTQIKLYSDPLFNLSHPNYVAQSCEDPFSADNPETW
jgi:hypothetical protein